MLPDSAAKDLLARAADTVEVTPSSGRALVASAQRSRNRRWVVAVGASAVTAVVVAGVAVAGGPDTRPVPAPRPVASSSPTPTPSDAPGGRVVVPVLVKYTEEEAVQRVQEWGLIPQVWQRAAPCRPVGAVVDQEPQAATKVAAGSVVRLFVAERFPEQADCPRGVAFDDDFRVARGLYDFSRGIGGASGPWSPRVTLAVEDTVRTSLTERQADERDRWLLDGEPGSSPDVDVLQHLADSGGEFRVDIGPHPNCVGTTPPAAPGLEGLRQLSITPTGPRESCLDWWALDVYLNDVGQIQYVSIRSPVTRTLHPRPHPVDECTAGDLAVHIRPEGDGAGQHSVSLLDFRNISTSRCLLSGYPRRVMLSEPGHRDVRATNGSFFPVQGSGPLDPGEVATLGVETDTSCDARPTGGPSGPNYHEVRISLPGGVIAVTYPRGGLDVGCGAHLTEFTRWQ